MSPAKDNARVLEIDGREVRISNPDKVVFPEPGLTKLDLVNYYLAVADGALRGVDRRPMVLKRFVKGITQEAFFQKRAPEKRPDWIETATLHYASGNSAEEVVVTDAAALAWVVNLGCIDLNPHPVRADDLEHPDELRVDLDPMPGVDWSQIVDVAMVAREVLTDHGLVGWPKTSGSRGIHIYARIERRWDFHQVRHAAETLAREVELRAPGLATARWWKEERGESVFVDFNQNAKDRTVASAYSIRPLPDARVSTPLDWSEVRDSRPERFTVATMLERFAERGDPAAGIDDAVGGLDGLLALAEQLGPAEKPPRASGAGRRTVRRGRVGPAAVDHAAHRDRPREDQARSTRGTRALEGPPPRRRRPAAACRRARRRHARQLVALVPHPGEPAARPRGAAPRAAGARGRLRPVGRQGVEPRVSDLGPVNPGHAEEAAWLRRWRLRPDADPVTTASSTLIPVRTEDDEPAMLKLAQTDEEARGADLLVALDGHGTARVLERDGSALLLERATGDRDLVRMVGAAHDDDATRIICAAAGVIHEASAAVLAAP